jgi:hypothetical protein
MATLAAALIGAGCAATAPPYNPFRVSQEEFHGKIKRVALLPVRGGAALPEPVRAKFDSLIEVKLREAGFSVVPARESGDIYDRMTKQLGGIFDPATGKRDESKSKTAIDYTRRELSTKFNIDAVLYPTILSVGARFAANLASWDGVAESTIAPGSYGSALIGTITALSLAITIEDRAGAVVYVNRGGIQLLTKIQREGLFQAPKFVAVPPIELFANEERTVAAVNIALAPLVKQLEPTDAPKPKP